MSLYLLSPDGEIIDYIDWNEGDAGENLSFARQYDGEGEFITVTQPTPRLKSIRLRVYLLSYLVKIYILNITSEHLGLNIKKLYLYPCSFRISFDAQLESK